MSWAEQWAETVVQTFERLRAAVSELMPNLIGALVILVAGYLVSKLVRRIVVAVLRKTGLDATAAKMGTASALGKLKVATVPSELLGVLVFWFIFLFFVVAAVDTLGLETLSQTVAAVLAYLPNVIGAVVIAIAGAIGAALVRDGIRGAAERVGIEYAASLARVAHGILLVLVGALAVGQLQLETMLVNRVVEILVLAGGASLALTLALGSRDIAKNIVAGIYARDVYRPDMTLAVASDAGVVEEVGTISTRIRTDAGDTVYIPNGRLVEMVVRGKPAREAQ